MGDKARRDYVKKCNRVFRLCQRVWQKRYKRQRSDDRSSESKLASKKKGRQSSGDQEDVDDKETSHPAKGWFSDRSSAFGVVDSGLHVSEMMQSARELILVDESDREYKRLQRPTKAVAKTETQFRSVEHSSR